MLIVNRTTSTNVGIFGEILYGGEWFCESLEHPTLYIPAGTYPLIKSMSPHLHIVTYELLNVPGRVGIRMHNGNWFQDSEGCIIVGREEASIQRPDGTMEEGVDDSKDTLARLMALPLQTQIQIIG